MNYFIILYIIPTVICLMIVCRSFRRLEMYGEKVRPPYRLIAYCFIPFVNLLAVLFFIAVLIEIIEEHLYGNKPNNKQS